MSNPEKSHVPTIGIPAQQKKALMKLFKGMEHFTSDDKSRPYLHHVYIPDRSRAEATDGHMAVRFLQHDECGHGLEPGFYLPKDALARLAADILPTPTKPLTAYDWPNFDLVFPTVPYPTEDTLVEYTYLSAKFLARVMDGLALLMAPWNSDPAVKTRTPPDATGPTRFEVGELKMVSVTAVLMPRRQ